MHGSIRIFLLFLLSLLIFPAQSQSIIPEDEVSISLQKRFYEQYPHASKAKWFSEEVDAHPVTSVEFLFQEKLCRANYDERGKRTMELKYQDSTPINLTNLLYERFDHFKLKSIAKKKLFSPYRESFVVVIKSKNEGVQEIELDEETLSVNQVVILDN